MFGSKRLIILFILGAVFAGMSVYALLHLSASARSLSLADVRHSRVLMVGALGLGALFLLSIWQILSLLRRLYQKQSGARLSLNVLLTLLASAWIPLGITAYFSTLFLSLDLDRAFNTGVHQALNDSLRLSRTVIHLRAQEALHKSRELSESIANMNHGALLEQIEALRRQSGAIALGVFDEKGINLAFAHFSTQVMQLPPPSVWAMMHLDSQQAYFEYQQDDDGNYIHVLSPLPRASGETFYLRSSYPMPESFNTLVQNLSDHARWQESYDHLRPHVRNSVFFALWLVFALSLLLSIWLSVVFSRYMTAPLGSLIGATQRIGEGDYHIKIKNLPHNELGKLGHHFNRMSERLLRYHQRLQAQNHYLESIMSNITAGVLVLDEHGKLIGHNASAARILACDLEEALPDAANAYGELRLALKALLEGKEQHWQQEINLNQYGQRKILMCHGSRYPEGLIVVFDDITDFLHNQRNAAWEEVAKRLAHEIKNPLTPIQLQAERLQRKLQEALPEQERFILQRATETIINQVALLKRLVSDFGQMARPLNLRRQALPLLPLLQELSEWYPQQLQIQWRMDDEALQLHADPFELRQVFNNLLKNAIEAGANQLQVDIQREGAMVHLALQDNGQGFHNLQQDPFEPYVSQKEKGTGLGLAIVRKIIHEHGGSIDAGNAQGGALIRLSLPCISNEEPL